MTGGAGELVALKGATLSGLTMNEAAMIQAESGYPLSLIKTFHSVEEYNIYREAGLSPYMVGNKVAMIRDIDWSFRDSFGRTNLERVSLGQAPLDPNGIAYELHHVGQHNDSVLAILTRSEHRGEGNFVKLHDILRGSEVDHGAAFATIKKEFWKSLASLVGGL